ncbi:hypothetical protein ASPZODRAFT_152115 [Penicilliopsis zonata CBS 506.65]|uniref:Zn(2)-C6 fungal-type domain-containing protein n=1 Tax=Penicilliopsis zonata CBS 506.65 TaxID=1073090 RepID=A0A1L9SHT2_9EURO|nr:hypothetical protein ASPZODRAFT_152115 [Penicilliopsis zonata CBS 506.65]OJJ46666.1 hypothetical protein ASPZODRAFT_152115 [Penicilliopsis zonata CBS 506.65]
MNPRETSRRLPPLAPGPQIPILPISTAIIRPKKNSTACLACKQSKKKCTGPPPPCKTCEATEGECIFDETLDRRRKVAVKRTIDELEYHKDVLHSLLGFLRSADPENIARLMAVIRTNASLEDIVTAISQNIFDYPRFTSPLCRNCADIDEREAQLSPLSTESNQRRSFVSLEKLCDIPLFRVPAKPWTSVTDDDHLVSHLVSLYFTWDHPCSQLIDQKLFLEHMVSRNTDSEFCTPFLVNSLLSVASAYSDLPEVLAVTHGVNSCGQHFYDEAEKLWKAEEGRATLVNIQGILLLGCFLEAQGKPEAGWLMIRQAVQLAQDFGIFQVPRIPYRNPRAISADMQHVAALTAWGVFILNCQMSMTLRKIANLGRPIFWPYAQKHHSDGIAWTPYPRSNQIECTSRPALLRCVMTELIKLMEIAWEIHGLLFERAFGSDPGDIWAAASDFHRRLQNWSRNLPKALDIDDQPVPQVLFLHTVCHQKIIALFSIFVESPDFAFTPHPSLSKQAEGIRYQSAKEIARFLAIQRRFYGLKHIPYHMLEATRTSLLALLPDLESDESVEAFAELCQHIRAFSTRFKSAKDAIEVIKSTARKLCIKLPIGVASLLDDPGTYADHAQDLHG